ncbi:MAG: hypothetical protein KAJ64_03145, partial [Thermoplasmata archaeon]|nr:hypothetical protein [Thermoplasmata archaeon]
LEECPQERNIPSKPVLENKDGKHGSQDPEYEIVYDDCKKSFKPVILKTRIIPYNIDCRNHDIAPFGLVL